MAFQIKPEDQRNGSSLLIPVPLRTRRQVEQMAAREGVSLSEVGRRALSAYLKHEPEHADGEDK